MLVLAIRLHSSPHMKVFHCDRCGQLLFFENTECVSCRHRVAYLPDARLVASLESDGDTWRSLLPGAAPGGYRLCQNDRIEGVCNWAVPVEEDNPLCASCRITRVIPNLADPAHRPAWYRLEAAKRRLLFTLIELGLPMSTRIDNPEQGLTFEFLADVEPGGKPILTGYADGVITVNIAEADDAEREKRRTAMREPFRTLLGHMRHESGHYWWDRSIRETAALEGFRSLFGDERADYAGALHAYYERGAAFDWQMRFVSAYASSHPWEDWAETWAHYLHMVDTLETAAACGLSLTPLRPDEPALSRVPHPVLPQPAAFDRLIESWFPVTYVLNNLNRGLGHVDAYPFVLSPSVIAKLRFVDDVVRGAKTGDKVDENTIPALSRP
jgi:hypothetical protein